MNLIFHSFAFFWHVRLRRFLTRVFVPPFFVGFFQRGGRIDGVYKKDFSRLRKTVGHYDGEINKNSYPRNINFVFVSNYNNIGGPKQMLSPGNKKG